MNCPSADGATAFHLSFIPTAITASLVNGIPSLDTCVHAPDVAGLSPAALNVVIAGLLAFAYTPITKSASKILVDIAVVLPAFCKVLIGTSMAIVWQLNFATPSLAPVVLNPPASNAPPKSTKNGSSTGPQKTFSPLDAVAIAAVIKLL